MKKLILITATLGILFSYNNIALAANNNISMAELCSNCHKAEPGLMTGLLASVSAEFQTIEMDLISHREMIRFNDDTELNNLESFEDLDNYRQRGFKIYFSEVNGEKIATEIRKFAPLDILDPSEIISKNVLKKIVTSPGVKTYDVRPKAEFSKGHIPGAISIPPPLFDQFAQNLPEDKETPVIFYGTSNCLSHAALIKAKNLGYNDVGIYVAGFKDWSTTEYTIVDVNWLKQAISKRSPHILIDLRETEKFENSHITGAISISMANLVNSRSLFPMTKETPVFFYGPNSNEAAKLVVSWGYSAVGIIPVSFDGWQIISDQIQKGPTPAGITLKS